jgi:ABC-type branched-subunit amino acid transport system ATPase component
LLSIEELRAGYGEADVLLDVSMEIGAHESIAIVGANGAGKSTVVGAICGLIPTRSGRILKDGLQIHKLAAHHRADVGIGVVLEDRHLFGGLSVRTNLELAAYRGRKDSRIRFSLDEVIALFPFIKERLRATVALLSGGEQQMVAIARALLLNPDLLILDEPSTGLAPRIVREVVGIIGTLRRRGLAVLLVEQNVALAAENSDRAYVMRLGKVVDTLVGDRWKNVAQDGSLVDAYL